MGVVVIVALVALIAGLALGRLSTRRRPPPVTPPVAPPTPLATSPSPSALAAPLAAEAASASDQLQAMEASLSHLRHDLRGALAPAMLVTERLLEFPDAKVQRTGRIVQNALDRAASLLEASRRGAPPAPQIGAGRSGIPSGSAESAARAEE
ncbi:MAG TPA: hypothetical protein VME92_10550 [Acetobacteraceae bacterium]|nr:hypothetical protein [Acetobacteraceae bacterium]